MALGYRTLDNIPHLRNYAAAVAHEARVKPIRGDADNTKPLGRRNQKYRHIRKEPDGSIVVLYGWRNHQSPLVRWRENGDICIYPNGYSQKATDGEIVYELLGWQWKSFDNQMWIMCETPTGEAWLPLASRAENVFVVKGTRNVPTFVNAPTHVTHQVNRRGKKEAMALYAEFRTYAHGMLKLRDRSEGLHQAEMMEVFGARAHAHNPLYKSPKVGPIVGSWNFRHVEAHDFCRDMRHVENPEVQYKAFLQLVGMCHKLPTLTEIDKRIERAVMMNHSAQCLKRVTHSDGKLRRDAYKWAVDKA